MILLKEKKNKFFYQTKIADWCALLLKIYGSCIKYYLSSKNVQTFIEVETL